MPEGDVLSEVKTRATIKDVLVVTDEKSALAKFYEVLGTGEDLASLQGALAETLNRLGNTGEALKFTRLAGETRNAEYLGKIAEANEDSSRTMGRVVGEFNDGVEKMGHVSGRMSEVADEMNRAASRTSSR